MNFGWIEIGLFYGAAVAFGLWQYFKMDRMLKATRAEKAAKEATEKNRQTPRTPEQQALQKGHQRDGD